MDTLEAFSRGLSSRNDPPKVFDWVKAAGLIADELESGNNVEAYAGLIEDWEWTAGPIFEEGAPVPPDNTYTYLSSTWATPNICINGTYTECFLAGEQLDMFDWDASTYWPEEALAILRSYVI